jgi:hypothetical protein
MSPATIEFRSDSPLYRSALAEKPARQVERLERTLGLHRIAFAASGDAVNAGIAKYDIEGVKLRLPVARSEAPKMGSEKGRAAGYGRQ